MKSLKTNASENVSVAENQTKTNPETSTAAKIQNAQRNESENDPAKIQTDLAPQ